MTTGGILCICGHRFPTPTVEGEVFCPECGFHVSSAYQTEVCLFFTAPGDPRPKDPNHHEHSLTLLAYEVLNAEGHKTNIPIRYCCECGMVLFEFSGQNYVMIPDWSRARLEAMTKETLKYISEPPMSVTKPVGGPRRKKVLGRGLKDLMRSSQPMENKSLAVLFKPKANT